jgi:iron-sulfur cluster repair protein YtfE (RIC family)
MHTLVRISHEHHDLMSRDVDRLMDLAGCLDCECLDRGELIARLPQVQEILDGLHVRLLPHMDAVEAAVYPTLDRLVADHGVTVVMATEHDEIRRLVAALQAFVDDPSTHADRSGVLALRRIVLRLHALLTTHLAEEQLYLPILEDRLTEGQEAALARALDHLASARL